MVYKFTNLDINLKNLPARINQSFPIHTIFVRDNR